MCEWWVIMKRWSKLWFSVLRLTMAWVVCLHMSLFLWCACVECLTVDDDGEGQTSKSICDGLGVVKGRHESLEWGPKDGLWIASTWTRWQANVHARMVVKTVLSEVKTMIGPNQGRRVTTWWSDGRGQVGHGLTSWRRHSDYATPSGLAVWASKPWVVCQVWSSKPGEGSRGGMWRHWSLASRWSIFMKGSWPSRWQVVWSNTWWGFLALTGVL
jgi:hypothetical protein